MAVIPQQPWLIIYDNGRLILHCLTLVEFYRVRMQYFLYQQMNSSVCQSV